MTHERVLHLDLTIQTENYIDINVESNAKALDFSVEGNKDGRLPYYEGLTTIDPRKIEQTLETANKSMSENVVINPIYYAETSNESGGYTAVIGME